MPPLEPVARCLTYTPPTRAQHKENENECDRKGYP